jgi:hypothetical protein
VIRRVFSTRAGARRVLSAMCSRQGSGKILYQGLLYTNLSTAIKSNLRWYQKYLISIFKSSVSKLETELIWCRFKLDVYLR